MLHRPIKCGFHHIHRQLELGRKLLNIFCSVNAEGLNYHITLPKQLVHVKDMSV
jgi:hypothetical protein